MVESRRGWTSGSIATVIYCVVPEPLADELYGRLAGYYEGDPNVTVIVDRRRSERREPGSTGGGQREVRDRRRPRVRGRVPADQRQLTLARRAGLLDSPAVQVVVHVDGGARGNPGPAAAAAVVSAPDGRVLDESAVTLGHATNNVAEYRAPRCSGSSAPPRSAPPRSRSSTTPS